ncbi:MAG: A/G-specific adenine glycosylase, partial [Alistipes sp.]|nr:A/G-specific adenine glycosylase [Alistipes sp.]
YQIERERSMRPHQLSHQRLHATFHRVQVEALPHHSDLIAIPTERLDDYAVSRLTDRYLAHE